MTKTYVKCFSVLICVLLLCVTFLSCSQKNAEVGKFSIDDYSYHIEKFTKDINVEKIKDADDAITKADKLFIETYGKKDTEDEKPYQAFFDEVNKCWYIKGTFEQPLFGSKKGGVAKVIFDSEGNVLALWHEK